MKEESFAMEMLRDYKKQNKRQFVIILVLIFCWLSTIGYLVFLLNDIGTIETTQEITDVEVIDNSNILNGDLYGQDKTNN